MTMIRKILGNSFILLTPILVWNVVFASKLPPAFSPESFNSGIPSLILAGENLFRIIIFSLPLFMKIGASRATWLKGLIVYATGSALYYLSWLALMRAPDSAWSNSAPGFIAPAYTPIIWLVGIGMMTDSYSFKVKYNKWHFICPGIAFTIFHVTHTAVVYMRMR